MATVIRLNSAASPLRNVSVSGLQSVAVGDKVSCRLESSNGDTRFGNASYVCSVAIGVRGSILAAGENYVASGAGWNFTLRCDTEELAAYIGSNLTTTAMLQVRVQAANLSETVVEAQNQITVFAAVDPAGTLIPSPLLPTYSEFLALEASASTAAESALSSAVVADLEADAALSSEVAASVHDASALSSAVVASSGANAALSSAVVASTQASVAESAASVAVAVVPSLSTAVSIETSERIARDISLTTRVSIEESTRLAQDNLKLDKSGGTVAGALTVQGVFTVAPASGSAQRYVNNPAGNDRVDIYQLGGVTDWRVVADQFGTFKWERYNGGAFQDRPLHLSPAGGVSITALTLSSTLTANGAATFNSTVTADTITNYAAEITITALLALTPAQSAKLRIKPVSNAYRLDGTIGRVLAQWDGDSSAGVWRISGSGVAVTAEFDAWARSCAQVGVNIPAVSRNGHWFRSYPLPWRGLPSSAWAVTSSGSAGSITYLSRMNAMYSASGAYGYSRRALSEVLDPRYSTHSYVACASLAAASSTAEPLYAFIGYISQADIVPLSSQQCAVALYDPDNKLGLGVNNSNVWLVTRTFAGVATIIDSGVAWQINNTTPREYQIVTSPTSVRLYSSGTLVAESSTNLPDSAVFATEGIVKVSGAVVRALYINGQHVTQAAS